MPKLWKAWMLSGDVDDHSWRTRANKENSLKVFTWFLDREKIGVIDVDALRAFFLHCQRGHEEDAGRWGKGGVRSKKPLERASLLTYHRMMKAFCNWCVAEEKIDESPMRRIKGPAERLDQVEPYVAADIETFLRRAKRTRTPERDCAIVLFLFGTGVRESELAELRMEELNLAEKRARVLGKGDKERTVHFGPRTAKALSAYLKTVERDSWDSVFGGQRGPLTGAGVRQIIYRLANDLVRPTKTVAQCHVQGATVHRFRHTFAVEFLRAGGDRGALRELLGHTTEKMLNVYVKFAQADIARQHRRHDPVEKFFRERR